MTMPPSMISGQNIVLSTENPFFSDLKMHVSEILEYCLRKKKIKSKFEMDFLEIKELIWNICFVF